LLSKLFSKKKPSSSAEAEKELSVEDLITLERYSEALDELKIRVKLVPKDLHSHLKIAEVYVALKDVNKALDSFMYVADVMAADGFFDKAIALLSKAAKMAPGNDAIPRRINRYRNLKTLEHRRSFAIEGLKQNKSTEFISAANSTLELEMLWNKIARSHLVANLDGEQLRKLFSVMDMQKMVEGGVLAKEGQVTPTIYLIVDGIVEAGIEIKGRYFDLRSFTIGDLIGDSALLEQRPWPATYTVKQSGTVFLLDRQGFEATMLGHSDPRAYISVLRQQHHDRDVAASAAKLRSR
jgi:CRP-like cAMP-binding protein